MDTSLFLVGIAVIVLGAISLKLHKEQAKKRDIKLLETIKVSIDNFITTNDSHGEGKPDIKTVKEFILHEAIKKEFSVNFIHRGCFVEVSMTTSYAMTSYYHVPFFMPELKMEDDANAKSSHRNDLTADVRAAQEFAVMLAAHKQLVNSRSLTRDDLEDVVVEIKKIYGDCVDVCSFAHGSHRGKIRITDRDNFDASIEQLFPCLK